jgi:hypothetical protein
LEVAERFADGRASASEVHEATGGAYLVWEEAENEGGEVYPAAVAVWKLLQGGTLHLSRKVKATEQAEWIAQAAEHAKLHAPEAAWTPADFLADLKPRKSTNIPPAIHLWEGGTISKMAAAIYDGNHFDRLPILADAVEEAGCTDRALLTHLRSGGLHAKGCWALDALLGKT